MRRLERTEQNAIRINDLLAELERRIPELDTQLRRAKRLSPRRNARVRDLEILSYLRAGASRRAERDALRVELERDEALRAGAAGKAAVFGADAAKLRTQLYRSELQLEELRSQAQHARGELAAPRGRVRRGAGASRSAGAPVDADDRKTRARAIRNAPRWRKIRRTRRPHRPAHGRRRHGARARARRAAALAQARAQARYGLHAIARSRSGSDRARPSAKPNGACAPSTLRAEADRLEREGRAARERAEQTEIAAGGAAHRYGERRRKLESLDEELLEARGRAEDAERDASLGTRSRHACRRNAPRSLGRGRRPRNRACTPSKSSRTRSKGTFPERAPSSKRGRKASSRGIEGIVSNLIATDERYARALDVAFGARLSNVVTTTSEDAERCRRVSQSHAGRARDVLPLDTLSDRTDGRSTPNSPASPA